MKHLLCSLFAFAVLKFSCHAALPHRLVLALDGVAYRDMKSLQEGVTYKDTRGWKHHRQSFDHGWFPVSRMVSTFPSASDTAWTTILGDRPLPGYQRTYFSAAANTEVVQNGVTTSMEYERQMTWQVPGGIRRSLGYGFPKHTFKYELREMTKNFLNATNLGDTFYAYFRSPDDAQHMSTDILAMLSSLDTELQHLQSAYKKREGHDLEILILSDHGNNHAGPARRINVQDFLTQSGYTIATSIRDTKDVVLPTAGIESWVEIHNSPAETEKLATLLTHLQGVDIVTAKMPGVQNQFLILNSKGERAVIDWDNADNSFRYSAIKGDPIGYLPVVKSLASKKVLDSDGFASADDWMSETISLHYPLALERIVDAHTKAALNPATILLSLDNSYVHSGWLVKRISELTRLGGTHGGLDDINSDGMLMSNFTPTHDTSANRVASLFGGFQGMREFRADESGAEWIDGRSQSFTAIPRTSLDRNCTHLTDTEVFLRVWTPLFTRLATDAPVKLIVTKVQHFIEFENHKAIESFQKCWSAASPVALPSTAAHERIYALPSDLVLEPGQEYHLSGRISQGPQSNQLFTIAFYTDRHGRPVAY